MKGRINRYWCDTCGKPVVTVDRDEGTTPFLLACRATEDCAGTMFSDMYKVDQTLTPTFEWYKPEKLPRDPGLRQHVELGGLLLRKIERT